MKILYLTDQLCLHGGIEKVLTQKANYLADIEGYEVTIVTYQHQDCVTVYPLSSKIKWTNLNLNYQITKSYFSLTNLKTIPAHIVALRKALKDIKPDILISCSFGPDFYFLPYITRGIPVLKEFHSSRALSATASSIKDRILVMLSARAERKYSQLVVLNSDELKYYSQGQISVIPNPVELNGVQAPLSDKKILAAGRISPVKNFTQLIKAFAQLSKDFPDWQLHIWGEDYVGTHAKLQMQIDLLGVSAQIRFMGTTDDLQSEMQDYSIYAMTSETECFPMVLLESLSAGLPVITYDAPTGPRHIVTDGEDGFLVPYKNLDIFTQKLKQLMTDENLRQKMGAKGRENVKRFAIDEVMQQWRTLFSQVIAERNPQPQPQP